MKNTSLTVFIALNISTGSIADILMLIHDEVRLYLADYTVEDQQTGTHPLKLHKFYQHNLIILESNDVYDMLRTELEWENGQSMFFVGVRKSEVPQTIYLKRLKTRLAREIINPLTIGNRNIDKVFR